jgi:hypothetical protein
MLPVIRKLRAELRAARTQPRSVIRLKEFSQVTWFVERMFFWAEFVSPGILYIPTRNLLHSRLDKLNEPARESYMIENMRHRSNAVDYYILSCIAVQLVLLFLLEEIDAYWVVLVIRVFVVVRIVDIAQANINMNIFDRLRYDESSHITVSVTRNLVLAALTFAELILSFGLLYATMPWNLAGAAGRFDALYFSMITQLTIGYGDIRPIHAARLLASLQGLVGFGFSLLIIGRFVSLIPPVRTMDDTMRSNEEETPL